MERLREGVGMDEFSLLLVSPQSKDGVRYKFKQDEITLLSPIDQIPVYRDFYVHEKHVKKGFEKRQVNRFLKNGMKCPFITKEILRASSGDGEEIMWLYLYR